MTSSLRAASRRMSRSRATTLVAALVGIALLSGMIALALTAGQGLPWRSYYDVTADFRSAANLGDYADVRIAGKRVGQVTGTSYSAGMAHVRLQLDPAVAPLRASTTARIRLKGLLGAKFVELHPGPAGAPLRDGATLPARQTSTTVDLFDLLQALDARRRAELRATLRALGGGFLARGEDINAAIGDGRQVLARASAITGAVNARLGAAARLFPSSDLAAAAFDPARWDFANGYDPQARALAPFVDRRGAIQQALAVAPGALDAIRGGLAQSDPLMSETVRFSHATQRLTRPAPAALREAAALLRSSRWPLERARVVMRATADAIPPTLRMTAALDPLAAPFSRYLQNSVTGLDELGRRSCDVLGQLRNWHSALSYGVESGNPIGPANVFRSDLGAGGDSVSDVPAKPGAVVGRDLYPRPCVLDQGGGR